MAPLPLPAPGTKPDLVPPDPEALTPLDFWALVFLGFCASPRWLAVRYVVVVCLHVRDDTLPFVWSCSCPETGAWRPEVDCTPTLSPAPGCPVLEQDSQYLQWSLPLLLIPFLTHCCENEVQTTLKSVKYSTQISLLCVL